LNQGAAALPGVPGRYALVRPSPTTAALFPYTTLSRSQPLAAFHARRRLAGHLLQAGDQRFDFLRGGVGTLRQRPHLIGHHGEARSEEHTSELQSRENLVCRLLLEKKKLMT